MKRTLAVYYQVTPDSDPDPSYLDQAGFEDERAAYYNDEWHFVGVRAAVEMHDWTTGVHVTVTSAGLWGIESISGEDYFLEVGAEELSALSEELSARGIDVSGVIPQIVYGS